MRRLTIKNVRTQVYSYLFFFEAKLPVRDIIPRGSSFQDFGENAAREEEIERKKKRKERRGRGGELPPWKSARKGGLILPDSNRSGTLDFSSRTSSRKQIKGNEKEQREKGKKINEETAFRRICWFSRVEAF